MTCDDAAYDGSDADFQRWYFGGSPPASDDWPAHAFEDALQGSPARVDALAVRPTLPGAREEAHSESLAWA